MNLYYEKDANMQLFSDKTIAVLGYGSQGHGQAQNLKDSGLNVIIGLYKGSNSWDKAKKDGFEVMTVSDACANANVIQLLISDSVQPVVFYDEVLQFLTDGKILVVSHGFNILYQQIIPPVNVDVIMIAPKSPGHIVRRMYLDGAGVPGIIAVHQDYSGKAKEYALAYAKGIGCTRAGVIETTFKEETETDLFGEQAVLCGGVTELIKAGFDTLVEAGYKPEVAYFECLNELKLIVDLIYEGGFEWMRYSVSDVAKYGDLTRGKRVIDKNVRDRMKDILNEVQSGQFALEWALENQAKRPKYNALLNNENQHLIESVGKELRAMMPWLRKQESN